MGFNNDGAEAAAAAGCADRGGRGIVGVNIGKTKGVAEAEAVADYVTSAERLAPLADYLVVNVSSPNTPGLRDLQAVDQLRPLLTAVREAADRASRAPRPAAGQDRARPRRRRRRRGRRPRARARARRHHRDQHHDLPRRPAQPAELIDETGGLSGAPLKARSLEVLRRLRARVGDRLALVSVGGVETADDAWERIRAGATLVQAYTGFIYGGPLWAWRVNRGLSRRLRASAFSTLDEARR